MRELIQKGVTMLLTTREVELYTGGQMAVHNFKGGYFYRGHIAAIAVEKNELLVNFLWFAKRRGFSFFAFKWVNDGSLSFKANLETYVATNMGPSIEVGGGDRICFASATVEETMILYPPDGSKLDPARVVGLELK